MSNAIIPIPRCPVSVRAGTMADFAFVDHWQNKEHDKVGWMPRVQLEAKINAGHVLIAEALGAGSSALEEEASAQSPAPSADPVGFVISQDQYFKRDDCGIVYQLCVVPNRQRGLIGATLIKSVFDRAAYGCRLFSCWCAQNLEANYFWESMGFIPLAFRSGAVGKKKEPRIHIFWQRRIRGGDTVTPYWFPSETKGGNMREDRLVLPIPPGTHWRDVMPVVLPKDGRSALGAGRSEKALPAPMSPAPKPQRPAPTVLRGLHFASPKPVKEKKERVKKPKVKNDPRHVAAARELNARYLEQFNAGQVVGNGKYDVARALPCHTTAAPLALPAAA